MTPELEAIFARAGDVCSELKATTKPDVQALLAIAKEVMSGNVREEESLAIKKQLGALVELVARREAQAMPFAALGRAALATLHHADKDAAALLLEFEAKLSMLGM